MWFFWMIFATNVVCHRPTCAVKGFRYFNGLSGNEILTRLVIIR